MEEAAAAVQLSFLYLNRSCTHLLHHNIQRYAIARDFAFAAYAYQYHSSGCSYSYCILCQRVGPLQLVGNCILHCCSFRSNPPLTCIADVLVVDTATERPISYCNLASVIVIPVPKRGTYLVRSVRYRTIWLLK